MSVILDLSLRLSVSFHIFAPQIENPFFRRVEHNFCRKKENVTPGTQQMIASVNWIPAGVDSAFNRTM
jgi:hypothetical protein